ncbi:hypothetical protein D9758_005088 [Tetrapyrgos nigripes]|uniref:Uncharacterized protein n=1 Tax=Tetrapyrgos nigripes TaxID=182062 RepID=A0A8H5GWP5_9AGAR|nr:hypothetical protein D9758_005088 [Tetrapyrgos nigripes]
MSIPTNPQWPSLYNPRAEIVRIEHSPPIQPGGVYLTDSGGALVSLLGYLAGAYDTGNPIQPTWRFPFAFWCHHILLGTYVTHIDVFRFTLYWTFVFYIPFFVVCGLYAFFNLVFPPSKESVRSWSSNTYKRDDDNVDLDADVDEELARLRLHPDEDHDHNHNYDHNRDHGTDIRLQPLTGAASATTRARAGASTSTSTKRPGPQTLRNLRFLSASSNWARNRYQTIRSDIVPPPSLNLADPDPQSPPLTTGFPTSTFGAAPASAPVPSSSSAPRPPVPASLLPPHTPHTPPPLRFAPKQNERRSRLTFGLLVLFVFLAASLLGAVISSAIIGFVIAGLYKAGGFYISTWVPFLYALIGVLVGTMK